MRAGNFGEVCGQQGGSFDGTGRCSVDAGQIWDPYLRTYDSNVGAAVWNNANSFIPYNNLALYTSPGSPNLPANLQPPEYSGQSDRSGGAEDVELLSGAEHHHGGRHLRQLDRIGPNQSYNDQFDIKVDHRFSEKNLMSVKYSYQYSHGRRLQLFQELHRSLRRRSELDQCPSVLPSTTRTLSLRPCC